MIVKNAGTYRLLEDFTMRGPNSVGTMPAGSLLTVSQINEELHKVIGPAFPDWCFWELPVEPYTEEMQGAEAAKRGKEYFEGTGKAFSQDQLDQYIGLADIQGINRERIVEFFDHWITQFFTKDQDNYPPEWSKEAADFFIDYFIKPTTIDGKS